jgi:hypothetical protein
MTDDGLKSHLSSVVCPHDALRDTELDCRGRM